jgi:hypothetical protein
MNQKQQVVKNNKSSKAGAMAFSRNGPRRDGRRWHPWWVLPNGVHWE